MDAEIVLSVNLSDNISTNTVDEYLYTSLETV